MTDSRSVARRPGKRERLAGAAARVLHEQGVERTTLADIARAADVPVGNVYYYFKTKDQLVEDFVKAWVDQRDLAARHGCPTGSLAAELDKRADGLDRTVAAVMRRLIDWIDGQFAAMGRADSRELGVALFAAYQRISLLTNTFRDPELMAAEGRRLRGWIDSLA